MSQLQKQAAPLCECLVDYEFSSPVDVRRECRTPRPQSEGGSIGQLAPRNFHKRMYLYGAAASYIISHLPKISVGCGPVAHPSLSNRSNRGGKFTQPWNSAANNCKSSLHKCLFEYENSRIHTYGAHLRAGEYIGYSNYLYGFFVILPCSHDLENVTSCAVSQGVRRTPQNIS